MLSYACVNKVGKALVKALSPESGLRSVIAIQKRNQCRNDEDNAAAKKQYDEQESQFTDQELNLFKKLFLKYDRDDNCKLDRWEFNQFAKFLVGRSYNSIDLEKVFKTLDCNDDGFLDWSEVMTPVMKLYLEHTESSLMDLFNEHDRDGDGRLKYWETKMVMEEIGLSSGFNKDLFNLMDRNSDSFVSFSEFSDYVMLRKYNSGLDLKSVEQR